jgi:hypothetical protein
MNLCLWQILVPCNWNNQKPIRTRHHKEWDKQIRKITGGLTIFPPVKGQWIDKNDGNLYIDRVIPVNIIATEKQMDKISNITLKHYNQLAVMYFKLSDHAIIKYKNMQG